MEERMIGWTQTKRIVDDREGVREHKYPSILHICYCKQLCNKALKSTKV